MTQEKAPPLAQLLFDQWMAIRLEGGICTAFVVRDDDLAELRTWTGLDKNQADPSGVTPTEFEGTPVYTVRPSEGVMVEGVAAFVRAEELEKMREAQPEGSPLPVYGLEPGDCWAIAEAGEDVPRSD